MTLNTATAILDAHAEGRIRRDDVALATVAHALYVVHTAAQKGGN
jgi:hypothetical protein